MKAFGAAAILAALAVADADHWAVVIANSKGYSYYGHQADSSHAVKLLLDNGIPRDHIIHFSYDDVAYDIEHLNPFPGRLYNKPSLEINVEGYNVYDYNNIDYRDDYVNKSNFIKVLLGDDTAPGPVLQSTKDSKVFVYMVGHGSSGVVPMPNGHADDWLYADELNKVL